MRVITILCSLQMYNDFPQFHDFGPANGNTYEESITGKGKRLSTQRGDVKKGMGKMQWQ